MRLMLIFYITTLLSVSINAQKPKTVPAYKLVWQDEFNKGKSIDTNKWTFNIGNGENGWGNNELEYYTNKTSNVRIENGHLIIEARKEVLDGKKYTSARILTQGKFAWTYGRFEVRAKLPKGLGTWPAIWMLGDNINTVGWPACGEIDMMEEVWKEPNVINWSAHSKMLNWPMGTQKTYKTPIHTSSDAFHVYRLDWTKSALQFFVDDKLYYTVLNDGKGTDYYPFISPQFLILNLAIGGNMAGSIVNDNIFPVKMEIDYVRVYQ